MLFKIKTSEKIKEAEKLVGYHPSEETDKDRLEVLQWQLSKIYTGPGSENEAEMTSKVLQAQADVEQAIEEYDHLRIEDLKKPRKYANRSLWSDVEPYEVVEVKTPNKIMVRAMNSEMTKPAEVIATGGFAAVFDNHTQEWKNTPNPEALIFPIRWSKAKMRWQDKWGNRYTLSDNPIKFYDNNF